MLKYKKYVIGGKKHVENYRLKKGEAAEGGHQGKFEVWVLIGWLLGIQEADWVISTLGYFMYRNFLMFFFRWGNKENISKNLYICYKTFLSIHQF